VSVPAITYVTTAARMAATAFREGRLSASPSRWMTDLRHLHGLMRARSTMAGPPPAAAAPGTSRQAFLEAARTRLTDFLESDATIDLTPPGVPHVSVLLVLHNRAELTLGCLQSLVAQTGVALEVVIVDNRSTDETPALLARVKGAHVIRSVENLGFLLASNRAAEAARGEHLLFLNNDTVVAPGTIAASLDTLTRHADIGAVGGRLIFPDGTLQEAGSIVWRDGSCLGYGRGDSPWLPAYAFERDVDFCSAAFLLTPRHHFDALGGFDTRYQPAYYEDADYCVRLWKAGLRVVYDPKAIVTHVEFGSADSAARAVTMQLERRTVFVAAHRSWLDTQPVPTPQAPRQASARRASGLRVLVVDDRVPRRSMGFGFPRAVALMSALVELGHSVTLVPTSWSDGSAEGDAEDFYTDIPRRVEVVTGGADRLRDVVRERRQDLDAVIVSRSHNMALMRAKLGPPATWTDGAAILYDAEALTATRDVTRQRLRGRAIVGSDESRLVGEELALAADVDAVLAVSQGECAAFERVAAGRVHRVAHSIAPTPTPTPAAARREMLFVGAFHDLSPNADSVEWFVTHVLPRVRARLPHDVTLKVVGPDPPPSVRALAGPQVQVLDAVADLVPLYDRARVFIAPTRFAAGIPAKVTDAAAYGVPVVATTLLADQLGWVAGQDLLAADEPDAFADACVELLCNDVTWALVRAAALTRIEHEHSPTVFRDALARALEHARQSATVGREEMTTT
jgi:GT2 family glycosyltransferase/glycosyltransferase involved in cell wall biosynthesis